MTLLAVTNPGTLARWVHHQPPAQEPFFNRQRVPAALVGARTPTGAGLGPSLPFCSSCFLFSKKIIIIVDMHNNIDIRSYHHTMQNGGSDTYRSTLYLLLNNFIRSVVALPDLLRDKA